MKPVLFRLPGLGISVYGFGLMVVVAFYSATVLAAWRSRREKLDPGAIYDLAIWVLIGGLVGARLFYVAEYWGEKVNSVAEIFRIWEGGIVFYGSVFGAGVAFFVYWAFRPFPILATLDALAPSIALGIALGRVGCFLTGCCYGDQCDIPWLAVRFPPYSPAWVAERAQGLIARDAPHSLPVHPTQLYAALDGLILLILLSVYYPLRRRDGEVIALLMLTYPVTRFLIERLRNDESSFFAGMTLAQLISLALFVAALFFCSYLAGRPATRLADESARAA
jgi:phosphatidylglycerol:prolipoprotein diacylglycerol transferase